jgi:hypothetical protein
MISKTGVRESARGEAEKITVINLPLPPVIWGAEWSLADTRIGRSGGIKARSAQIPKLIQRLNSRGLSA